MGCHVMHVEHVHKCLLFPFGCSFKSWYMQPSEAFVICMQAAEERAKRQRIMSNGPQKLGGDKSIARTLSPAEAAAQAAERRARDNVWCPSEQLGQLSLEEVEGGTGDAAGLAPIGNVGDRLSQGLGLGPGDTPLADGVAGPSSSGGNVAPSSLQRRGLHLARSANVVTEQGSVASVSGEQPAQQPQRQVQQQQQQQQQRHLQTTEMQQQQEQQQWQAVRASNRADTSARVVDLTLEDDTGPSTSTVAAPAAQQQQRKRVQAPLQADASAGIVWRKPRTASPERPAEPSGAQELHSSWTCSVCTLQNRPLALICEACLAERPM